MDAFIERFKETPTIPLLLKQYAAFKETKTTDGPLRDNISVVVRTLARMKLTSEIFAEVDPSFKNFSLVPISEDDTAFVMSVCMIDLL